MTRVFIIYWRYYDFFGRERAVGGIETYIHHLTSVTSDLGYVTFIYQCAAKNFVLNDGLVQVVGIKTPSLEVDSMKNLRVIMKAVLARANCESDIILFAQNEWSIKLNMYNTVSIQHGIAWDKPIEYLTQKAIFMTKYGEVIKRFVLRRHALKYFNRTRYKVCVDYNFLNWYRTYKNTDRNTIVIPNSTELCDERAVMEKLSRGKGTIRILFARRFELFRGSRVIVELIKRVLQEYDNVVFTIAGSGTDEGLIKTHFANEPKVKVMQYISEEAVKTAFDHDITLVPSFGSEGTSFSVVEGFAAGTAVVAFDTGGITNMIINGYNGILVGQDIDELCAAVKYLIQNGADRNRIALNAYNVCKSSFSIENWSARWRELLMRVGS